MLFNSYEFIFMFLPITFFVYFYLLEQRLIVGAKGFLVFASLFFYSWWNIAYLPLILGSMLFNYIIGNSLNENFAKVKISKKSLLSIGIVANIVLLGYFKYSDFFIENFNFVFNSSTSLLHLALPLAISFFTFQQIAYLVDSYRNETSEYDFLNYALFVTFFPQLIAGPIVHHSEMMPQFASQWNLVKRYKNIAAGFFIFSIGLFKKVVIADQFAVWANAGFNTSATLNMIEAWVTSLSYTFQLYFDFSGYTDMAIGAALLFNIVLPINFNSPYKALNIQEFWQKWHITLSRFLKEYVYIPLGGNRKGDFKTYTNLFSTFIIGGIWHGAGWTFVFWGFLHGIALVIHRLWSKLNIKMPKFIAWFITFNFINIAWVFFRANEFGDALKLLNSMFSLSNIVLPVKSYQYLEFLNSYDVKFAMVISVIGKSEVIYWVVGAFILTLMFKNSTNLLKLFSPSRKNLYFILILFFISVLFLDNKSDFLYFNF